MSISRHRPRRTTPREFAISRDNSAPAPGRDDALGADGWKPGLGGSWTATVAIYLPSVVVYGAARLWGPLARLGLASAVERGLRRLPPA